MTERLGSQLIGKNVGLTKAASTDVVLGSGDAVPRLAVVGPSNDAEALENGKRIRLVL